MEIVEERKHLKIKINKILSIIAILLMSTGVFATAIPLTIGHTPAWNIPTYAYVTASPATVGKGQYTLLVMWLDKYPPTAGGAGGDRWQGFALTITKPDGTTEKIPYTSQTSAVASAYISYTPDQIGNYSIVFSWPGQTLTNGTGVPNAGGLVYVGDYFMPSTSAPFILTVQQAPVETWVEPPIPTGYWDRPISTANRQWVQLLSNWLGGSWFRYTNFQESGYAPNSPHILYAKSIIAGGSSDQRFGAIKYDPINYQNMFSPNPIIMDGVIYLASAGVNPRYGYTAINLKTGQTLWQKNGTDNGLNNPVVMSFVGGGGATGPALTQTFPQLSFGQLYYYDEVNGAGISPYLWMTQTLSNGSAIWYMLDANTGNWIMSLINVPGGTASLGQDGSILRYSYNAATGNILCWNSSQSIGPSSPIGTGQAQWKPRVGATLDAVNDTTWTKYGLFSDADINDIGPRSGYTMNVTGPKGLPALSTILRDQNNVPKLMIFNNLNNLPSFGSSDMTFQYAVVQINEHVAPYSPLPDKTYTQNNNLGFGVSLLYNKTLQKPMGGNLTFSFGPISYENNVFTLYSKETRQWWGYSLTDGSLLWGPTASQSPWDMYGSDAAYANGVLFSGGYGGVLHAYSIVTGKELWSYTLTQIGYESPYGNFQCTVGAIADGKIFIYSMEHSPTQPMWRGSYLRAINVTNGALVWKNLQFVSGFSGGNGIVEVADGAVVAGNDYDNRMYVYSKGPSAITVNAPDTVIPKGTPVLIKGTVTDQSPGNPGIPAISDVDQEQWMEYIYMEQAKPTHITGVPVHLTAMDPNGNFQDIGTFTSDMSGLYSALWTPPIEGKYTVTATFAGSESYDSSQASTAFGVATAQPAPVVTSGPTSTASATTNPTTVPTNGPSPSSSVQPPGNAMPMTTLIAIISAVVIIVAAAAALVLRRRRK
jgi:hypothetical protein